MTADHEHIMRTALALARRQLGQTWPNPAVGAVVVNEGEIIAAGVTAQGGRPHAETQALEQAGDAASGATLYVTLEPCVHEGQTPPCTDMIIQSGIRHVVVACEDPNPEVNGGGIRALKEVGIKVTQGICRQEAEEVNRGFFSAVKNKRPFVALKTATSMDGKIATKGGHSQWITSDAAREYGHKLRSQYDAVVTGIGTVLADNPMLDCRLPGLESHSPVRVVFDSKLRLPIDGQLAQTTSQHPVWCMSTQGQENKDLAACGVRILPCGKKARVDIKQALEQLTKQGITRILVEAGSQLSTAFLQSGLVDRIYWFKAPLIIGNDGLPAFGNGFNPELSQLQRWTLVEHVPLLPDSMDILECSPVS